MPILDISRKLQAHIATWEGDTPFQLKSMQSLSEGDSINLSTLVMSIHTGTHVYAPYHFAQEGEQIHELALESFWGPAQVVQVDKAEGALLPEDFTGKDLTRAPRLLVKSASSGRNPHIFFPDFVFPHPELVSFLASQGVILWGTDAPSVDPVHSKDLKGHHALHRSGISILEGLELSAVEEGLYELCALPLKIDGGDGSPVRAVLRY